MAAKATQVFLPVLLVCAAALPLRPASAQCQQWESTFATQGFDGAVRALVEFQPCTGGEPSLYAGGSFTTAGGVPAARVARWNGSVWSPVGAGLPGTVNALCVFDDNSGGGPELYAGGFFGTGPCGTDQGLAKWDGSTWTMLCDPAITGGPAPIEALAVFDSGFGPGLFVGGLFDVVVGGTSTSDILRWSGSNFSKLGAGARGTFTSHVAAMTVFDPGSGPVLVVAGEFSFPSNAIARWNGSSWSTFGSGLGGFMSQVLSLAVFDDGSGQPRLYAGGAFGSNFSRWSGSAWQSVGGSVNGAVRSLIVYDQGSGSESLYAGGDFSTVNALPANRIARWDGASWSTLDTGIDTGANVLAMAEFDDHASGGSDLYVGGNFTTAGGTTSPSIAQWSGCGMLTGAAFCFGDGSLPTPCPCAPPNTVPSPPAALNHGCANSFNLDGAKLFGSGSTALDDVVLTTSGQTPVGFSFFLVGTAQDTAGVASADGIRCVDGALTRFGSQYATCGSVKYPNPAVGWTLPLSVVSGTTPGSAVWKYYQVFYRNALVNFCTGATTNFTSGYGLRW